MADQIKMLSRLKEVRLQTPYISNTALARVANVGKPTVIKLQRAGALLNGTELVTVYKLAQALGCAITDLWDAPPTR